MSIEQRAHDLTILYIKIVNDLKLNSDESSTNAIEINLINDYLKFYPIVLEQIKEDFMDK